MLERTHTANRNLGAADGAVNPWSCAALDCGTADAIAVAQRRHHRREEPGMSDLVFTFAIVPFFASFALAAAYTRGCDEL